MPRPIGVIQKPGLFEDLLRRTGVNRPQQPFVLDGDVVPVILVDSAVSFVAAPTPAYTVPDIFTAGVQIAPAISTVLADTGQLSIGFYTVISLISIGEGARISLQWRDAANAVTLMDHQFFAGPTLNPFFSARFAIENDNERFRVINNAAGGVGIAYQATLFAKI